MNVLLSCRELLAEYYFVFRLLEFIDIPNLITRKDGNIFAEMAENYHHR